MKRESNNEKSFQHSTFYRLHTSMLKTNRTKAGHPEVNKHRRLSVGPPSDFWLKRCKKTLSERFVKKR